MRHLPVYSTSSFSHLVYFSLGSKPHLLIHSVYTALVRNFPQLLIEEHTSFHTQFTNLATYNLDKHLPNIGEASGDPPHYYNNGISHLLGDGIAICRILHERVCVCGGEPETRLRETAMPSAGNALCGAAEIWGRPARSHMGVVAESLRLCNKYLWILTRKCETPDSTMLSVVSGWNAEKT